MRNISIIKYIITKHITLLPHGLRGPKLRLRLRTPLPEFLPRLPDRLFIFHGKTSHMKFKIRFEYIVTASVITILLFKLIGRIQVNTCPVDIILLILILIA